MNIAYALKESRKFKGWKQIEMAEKVGISQTYLSQIETGAKKPSTTLIEKFCKVLGVPIQMIFSLGMDESDVPKEKRDLYAQLKPVMNGLVAQIMKPTVKKSPKSKTKK